MRPSDPANLAHLDVDRTRELKPEQSDTVLTSSGPDILPPGTMAGQYMLQRLIGSGGGGMVYAAEHRLLKRPAAVKVLRREKAAMASMVTRFLREAMAVNMIRHPNIVDIFEFGELADGRPFYVMELLEGTNLRKLVQLRGRFSPTDALGMLEPVCGALEAAHRAGVVHRDLKASNITVLENGTERVVKLLDFGIAKLLHPEPGGAGLTEAGSMLGTSHYMAPEQVRGEQVDTRVDVYALGVLLYQLLTAQYPFQSEKTEEIAWMHLTAPVPRVSQSAPVPPALDDVVIKAMEKDRDKRYPSVTAFLEGLKEACGAAPLTAEDEEPVPAAGIYVEVRVSEEVGEDLDDALLDDIGRVLDDAEGRLIEAQFLIPLHTSNAILGVRRLAGGGDVIDEPSAVALAHELHRALSGRDDADARVHVNVSVRIDSAVIRARSSGDAEVVGGALLSFANWAPEANTLEVEVSRGDAPPSP
jgi:eukaryotic-like serine/threonine-protein kinase